MSEEPEGTTPKFLRDQYAIIGIGETEYTRGSGVTTRKLATWAIRNAMEDAGITVTRNPADIGKLMKDAVK